MTPRRRLRLARWAARRTAAPPRAVVALTVAGALGVLASTSGCTSSSSGHGSSATSASSASSARPTSSPVGPVSPSGSGDSTLTVPRHAVVLLSKLDGATVPTSFTLVDDTQGVTEAKFYLVNGERTFISRAKASPFSAAITVPAGPGTIEVRHTVDGSTDRVTAHFTARADAGGPSTTITVPSRRTPLTIPNPTARVSTSAELAAALADARPGAVIELADGTYQNDGGDRWHLAATGTAVAPIYLVGGRGAVLESDSTKGDYGLWITGSYWRVSGISVRNATKGIVLDGSQHTIIDDVDVSDVGQEGVHLRKCSSDDIVQNSAVHDTGLDKPQYGEGLYVGSASSNWSDYGCADGRDGSQRNLLIGNTVRHTAAEGADLKEGTDSGSLIANSFVDTGYSGENSADSAVDVKGNGWTIVGNTVSGPQDHDLDAFQTHTVYSGYGTDNTFAGNRVLGAWRGFGFALHPRAGNVVSCTNTAPDAVQGLVADGDSRISCTR